MTDKSPAADLPATAREQTNGDPTCPSDTLSLKPAPATLASGAEGQEGQKRRGQLEKR
jgi:hypothetical protein